MAKRPIFQSIFDSPSNTDDAFAIEDMNGDGAITLSDVLHSVIKSFSGHVAPVDFMNPSFGDDAQFNVAPNDAGSNVVGTTPQADVLANLINSILAVEANPVESHTDAALMAAREAPAPAPPDHVAAAVAPHAFNHTAADDPAFVFHQGNFGQVVISNFVPGSSVIEFDKHVFANFAEVQAHLVQAGPDAVISRDYADFITIKNVDVANLHASDFLFV